MAVGFEFLLFHGLQIFPCFPLQIFLQIESEVCASDVVSHRLFPPFQAHLRQIFVAFRCGTDIIKDCDTGFVIRSEIPDQTATTADYVQPHQVRVVFIFAECGENISHILSGNCCNAVQIRCGNISCSEPKNLLHSRFLDFYSKPVQNGILCGNHALVYPEFFCPAAALLCFFVVDIQDIHGSVPDICKEIGSLKISQMIHNSRISLWVKTASCKADVIVFAVK